MLPARLHEAPVVQALRSLLGLAHRQVKLPQLHQQPRLRPQSRFLKASQAQCKTF